MPTLVTPFINRKAINGGHSYEGGGDAAGTVFCRWYWLEVSAGSGGTHQGNPQVHQGKHDGGALVLPNPGGWEERKQHTSGTVTLKSSPKEGKFSGSDVVTEDTATVPII